MDMSLAVSMFSTAFALMALAFSVFKSNKSTGLDALSEEVGKLRAEVASLRAQLDTPAPPPLPRARTGRLDDLREQLRSSTAEDDEGLRSD